jgi:MFS transporter, ACS family, glucarate transporter
MGQQNDGIERLRHATQSSVNCAVPLASRQRYRVVVFTLTLVAIAYLDRVCISTAAPTMQKALGLGDFQMGMVFSAFTLSYAMFEIPSGWLADRFGARITLTRIVLLWSAMTAATGLVTGFASLLAVRALFGMGEAGAYPSTGRIFSRWLPPAERGRAFGLVIATGPIAGALTQPLVVYLIGASGWRSAFYLFGCVGLVWVIAFFLDFRDDPREHRRVTEAELREIGPGAMASTETEAPLGAMLASRTVVALSAMYFGAIYGWYFYLTFLPKYLLDARGFDMSRVGWLSAAPLGGIAVGVLLGGYLADRLPAVLGRRTGRRIQGLVGLPLAALAVVLAAVTPSPILAVCFLTGAAALAALGVAPAWTVCVEVGGARAGAVTGMMNTFGNLGGATSPLVFGACLYRYHSYDAPLFSMAALYLFSAACWLAVDPEKPIV